MTDDDQKMHDEGLILAILSCDSKAQAALDYIRKHDLVGWSEAENLILEDIGVAIEYMQTCLNDSWPKLKERCSGSPEDELLYAAASYGFYINEKPWYDPSSWWDHE